MNIATKHHLQQTHVWNEVKNWAKEDKVNLITLLSISLTEPQPSSETPEQKTRRMIAKYAGCWRGDDNAEDTIRKQA